MFVVVFKFFTVLGEQMQTGHLSVAPDWARVCVCMCACVCGWLVCVYDFRQLCCMLHQTAVRTPIHSHTQRRATTKSDRTAELHSARERHFSYFTFFVLHLPVRPKQNTHTNKTHAERAVCCFLNVSPVVLLVVVVVVITVANIVVVAVAFCFKLKYTHVTSFLSLSFSLLLLFTLPRFMRVVKDFL